MTLSCTSICAQSFTHVWLYYSKKLMLMLMFSKGQAKIQGFGVYLKSQKDKRKGDSKYPCVVSQANEPRFLSPSLVNCLGCGRCGIIRGLYRRNRGQLPVDISCPQELDRSEESVLTFRWNRKKRQMITAFCKSTAKTVLCFLDYWTRLQMPFSFCILQKINWNATDKTKQIFYSDYVIFTLY